MCEVSSSMLREPRMSDVVPPQHGLVISCEKAALEARI
jgi:hypothetical protein